MICLARTATRPIARVGEIERRLLILHERAVESRRPLMSGVGTDDRKTAREPGLSPAAVAPTGLPTLPFNPAAALKQEAAVPVLRQCQCEPDSVRRLAAPTRRSIIPSMRQYGGRLAGRAAPGRRAAAAGGAPGAIHSVLVISTAKPGILQLRQRAALRARWSGHGARGDTEYRDQGEGKIFVMANFTAGSAGTRSPPGPRGPGLRAISACDRPYIYHAISVEHVEIIVKVDGGSVWEGTMRTRSPRRGLTDDDERSMTACSSLRAVTVAPRHICDRGHAVIFGHRLVTRIGRRTDPASGH
jgi:hypothetical protein